jgi:L-cystine transport system substrate-binding protein
MLKSEKKAGLMLFLVVLSTLSGCSRKTTPSGNVTEEIVVAYIGGIDQFQYEDINGNLTGLEIETLKAIDDALPQYQFKFESYGFADSLIAVENGKADIAVCQFAQNEERKQRFIFSTAYGQQTNTITVSASNQELINSIKSISDLQGKTIWSVNGNDSSAILETFNAEHPDNPIAIDYSSAGIETTLANLNAGAIDAIAFDLITIDQINTAFGQTLLVAVGEPISVSTIHFIINKDKTLLKSSIDEALSQLIESKKLRELSQKFLGFDISLGL